MKIAYFDCFSGISGDMTLGALVDAGLEFEALRAALAGLPLAGYELRAARSWRSGLAGTKVDVVLDQRPQPARGFTAIADLIGGSALSARVKEQVVRTFEILGRAEARVHGCALEEVHFHEVGAVDAIVDITGSCVALELLGVEAVFASEVVLGRGYAHAAHGKIPVPAMATIEVLRDVPVTLGEIDGELTTPTGAALLKSLAVHFGRDLSFVPLSIGYGFGTRERENPPNALRVILAHSDVPAEHVVVLSCNLDDATGQQLGFLIERSLELGALDCWVIPTTGKKSRPAHLLSVLCDEAHATPLEAMLFRESPTLGVRRERVERRKLERAEITRQTAFGAMRFKVATLPGGERRTVPEYDDVAAASRRTGTPFQTIYRALLAEIGGG
ncbi:MAG: nickel pincer cofactor biosynthesis protein LarC [Planctomycetota bacterium]